MDHLKKTKINYPNYRKIFSDIIDTKFPDKRQECENLLNKQELSFLDIIKLDQKIFGEGDKDVKRFNQREKAYDNLSKKEILEYQIRNKLNNIQLASCFHLSRNTITKWKKEFKILSDDLGK